MVISFIMYTITLLQNCIKKYADICIRVSASTDSSCKGEFFEVRCQISGVRYQVSDIRKNRGIWGYIIIVYNIDIYCMLTDTKFSH